MAETKSRRGGNMLPLLISQALVLGIGFGQQVILARWLGKDDYGVIGFVLGAVTMFSFLSHADAMILVARNVTADEASAARQLRTATWALLLTNMLAASLTVLVVAVADGRPVVVIAAVIASATAAFHGQYFNRVGVLQGLASQRKQVVPHVAGRLATIIALVALLYLGFGVIGAFLGSAIGTLVSALSVQGVVRGLITPEGKWLPDWGEVRSFLRTVAPFAMKVLFMSVYIFSDVLVVQAFHGSGEVGIYRSASTIPLQLPIAASLLAQVSIPKLTKLKGDHDGSAVELGYTLRMLLTVALPIAAGGALVAGPLIVFLFGVEYAAGDTTFMVLMAMLPFRFMNSMLGMVLATQGLQNARARVVMVAAIVNVALNMVIVPYYGGFGAALTTLVTDVILSALMFWAMWPTTRRIRMFVPMLRVLVALACMGVVVWLLSGQQVLLVIGAGVLTYLVVGLGIRAFSLSDLRRLRGM